MEKNPKASFNRGPKKFKIGVTIRVRRSSGTRRRQSSRRGRR